MDVAAVRAEREWLEEKVANLVRGFEAKTGTRVESLKVTHIEVTEIDTPTRYAVGRVSAWVEL